MVRFSGVLLLGGLAIAFSPSTASAQYGRGGLFAGSPLYVYPNGGGGYSYGVQLGWNMSAPSIYGPINFGYYYPVIGPSYAPANSPPDYSGGYGYFSGGYSGYDSLGAQQGLAAAQQAAGKMKKGRDDAREMIDAQWAYEKLGATGQVALKGAKDQVGELQKALAVKDETEVASGAALNRILVAIVVEEGKGAKGVAAFLPPQLLEDARFSGGPVADILNLVRLSGKLPFPPNFPGPALEGLQTSLQTDFSAAITPLRAGKQVDAMKVAKLDASLKKLEAAAPPVIRNLSFDDAIAARKFLNQFASAIEGLRSTNLAGLINPKWATDGTSVTELVKFMTKNKLMFAPAPAGNEGSYFSLHKALATYLFVLNQSKK